jgi:hypothetical protein
MTQKPPTLSLNGDGETTFVRLAKRRPGDWQNIAMVQ